MDYTELLPPLPVGDRFIDQTKFRRLGRGSGHELYECWDDAIQAYALAAIAAAAPAIRRAERERIIAECIPGGSVCDPQQVADAIRALPDEAHNVEAKGPSRLAGEGPA